MWFCVWAYVCHGVHLRVLLVCICAMCASVCAPVWWWCCSVCSAVGVLPLSLQYGPEVVSQFLAGAHAVDTHFLTADFKDVRCAPPPPCRPRLCGTAGEGWGWGWGSTAFVGPGVQ